MVVNGKRKMVDVYISLEEKKQTLEELRRMINEYPFIPVFKDEDELKWSLEHGNIDFIADTKYWIYSTMKKWGIVRPIKPWGRSEIGYKIRALSMRKAIECVNSIIMKNKGKYMFIYFRIFTPDIPPPRRCYVEESLADIEEWIAELSKPGEYIDEEFYDR